MGLLSAAATIARSKLSALSSRIASSGATPANKTNNKRMLMVERVHKGTRDYSIISTENNSLKMVRSNLPDLSFLTTENYNSIHQTANYNIIDSCNTWILLCCKRDPQVSWQFLWYPTTGETKPIPPSLVAPGPLPDPLNRWFHRSIRYDQVIGHHMGYGLGFDPVSGDYKVVRTHLLDYDNNRVNTHAEVFSLKTGSWKRIYSPGKQYYRNASVHINGAHYFLAWDGGYVVNSFDFVNDRYVPYLIFIPKSDKIGSNFISTRVVLAEFHGSLACVIYDFKHEGTLDWKKPCFEIWVWDGSRWSWESTHNPTPLGIYPLYSVVGLYENDKVFLRNAHGDLLYYNCVTRDMEYLDIGIHDNDSSHLCVYPYIQSSTPQFDGLK